MKKLFVSLFVLGLFAITTVSAQRSSVPANGVVIKQGNAYIVKGVKISDADQKALLRIGERVAKANNSYGQISTKRVKMLKVSLHNSPSTREWWAIKNKDKWAFGGDIKVNSRSQARIDRIMGKYMLKSNGISKAYKSH